MKNSKDHHRLPDQQRQLVIQENLINSLRTGDEKARKYAIDELAELFESATGPKPMAIGFGISEKAIPTLVLTLLDSQADIQEKAAQLLPQLDPQWQEAEAAREVLPSLINKLKSSSKATAVKAFRLLRKFEAHALPDLLSTLISTESDALQLQLIQLIGQIEGDISEAIPALTTLLDSKNGPVREVAIQTLNKMESQDQALMRGLLGALEDDVPANRAAALNGLAGFDNFTSVAIESIVKCLLDPFSEVRQAAEATLAAIGAPVVDTVITLVEQRALLRKQELERLKESKGQIFKGIDMEKFYLEPNKAMHNMSWHVNDIREALQRVEDGILRGINVLARLQAAASPATKVLEEVLMEPDHAIRDKAVFALGAIGPHAINSTSALLGLYRNTDFKDYEGLVHALNNIRPDWDQQEEGQLFLNFLMRRLEENSQQLEVLLALKAMNKETLKKLSTTSMNTPTVFNKDVLQLIAVLGDQTKEAEFYLAKMIEKEQADLIDKPSDRKQIGFNRS